MIVYLWTAFLMVFYASNVPLTLVVDVDTARGQSVKVGVGVFVRPKTLRAPKNHDGKTHIPGIPRATAVREIFFLIRHVRFHGEAALCAGDAALTAILSGAVMALTLGRVRVTPDFSTEKPRLCFFGMVSIKPGHIMGVALVWAREEISGRINTWRSTRSRA